MPEMKGRPGNNKIGLKENGYWDIVLEAEGHTPCIIGEPDAVKLKHHGSRPREGDGSSQWVRKLKLMSAIWLGLLASSGSIITASVIEKKEGREFLECKINGFATPIFSMFYYYTDKWGWEPYLFALACI